MVGITLHSRAVHILITYLGLQLLCAMSSTACYAIVSNLRYASKYREICLTRLQEPKLRENGNASDINPFERTQCTRSASLHCNPQCFRWTYTPLKKSDIEGSLASCGVSSILPSMFSQSRVINIARGAGGCAAGWPRHSEGCLNMFPPNMSPRRGSG